MWRKCKNKLEDVSKTRSRNIKSEEYENCLDGEKYQKKW